MVRTDRWKRLRPSLVTVIAVTVGPVLLLFGLQWYLLDRFETVTRLVLKQASQEVAGRFASQIRQEFESPTPNLIEVVPHDAVRRLEWDRVAAVLDAKKAQFPIVDSFLMWSRADGGASGAQHPGDAVVFYPMHRAFSTEQATSREAFPNGFFTESALSNEIFSIAVDEVEKTRGNFGFAQVVAPGHDYYVVFHFIYDANDRTHLGAIMGLTIDMRYLRERYFTTVLTPAALKNTLLPGFPPPTATVVDDRGTMVYAVDREAVGSDEDSGAATFPLLFFNVDLLDSKNPLRASVPYWTIRSGYARANLASIVHRQTNQQRALWCLLLLITVGGFALAVRATIQQVRLAHLRSAFVSSVSHELKTPLTKIRLFTETLSSGRLRSIEKMQEYYEVIEAQTSKLERLVDGILEFTRFEAGVQKFRREPVDLRVVAQSALESYEHDLARAQFHVETAFATQEVLITGDPEQLQTAVENLVANAIKYSNGTRFISVAVKNEHKHAVIEVADRGVGIPAPHIPHVFKKFYRVSPKGDEAPSGFGLGLAIVEHICVAHGGRVTVDSEPGTGSTFRVHLPMRIRHSGDRV